MLVGYEFGTIGYNNFKRTDFFLVIYGPVQTIGARATALCSGTKKDVLQTPWCPRSNRVRHFVCCIVRRHEEKTWERWNGARVLPLEVVPMPGHGAQIFAEHRQKALFRLAPVPENWERTPSLNGAYDKMPMV